MKVIVTGIAGFIGYHTARALLAAKHTVVGADNLSAYYAVQLKRDRLAELARFRQFEFNEIDVGDLAAMVALFSPSCGRDARRAPRRPGWRARPAGAAGRLCALQRDGAARGA